MENDFPDIDDAVNLTTTMALLGEFGFTAVQVDSIIKLIAGLLHLGDLRVHERTGLTVNDLMRSEQTALTARLIEVPVQDLIYMIFGKDHRAVLSPLEPLGIDGGETANRRSDELATALYFRLFQFIVQQVNQKLAMASSEAGLEGSGGRVIKVVDGLGWNASTRNSMAQLVRNYTSEKLSKHFCDYEYYRVPCEPRPRRTVTRTVTPTPPCRYTRCTWRPELPSTVATST